MTLEEANTLVAILTPMITKRVRVSVMAHNYSLKTTYSVELRSLKSNTFVEITQAGAYAQLLT